MGNSDESPCREYFDSDDLSLDLRFSIRADIDEIDPAVEQIMAAIRSANCVDVETTHVDVALREALANAVIHGSRRDRRKNVEIFVACKKSSGLIIVVRDHGAGFNPRRVPSPLTRKNLLSGGGRGIFLINELMDEVSFRKGGTEIHMKKTAGKGRPGGTSYKRSSKR